MLLLVATSASGSLLQRCHVRAPVRRLQVGHQVVQPLEDVERDWRDLDGDVCFCFFELAQLLARVIANLVLPWLGARAKSRLQARPYTAHA
eukprot:4123608-Pleurochrysis_carterae.AAC.1